MIDRRIRRVLLAVMLATLAGCGEAPATAELTGPGQDVHPGPPAATVMATAEKMLGLWVASEQGAADQDEKAVLMERAIAAHTFKFEFRPEHIVWLQFGRDVAAEQGTWNMVGTDGPAMTVRIASPSYGEMDFGIEFLDEGRFTMRQLGSEAGPDAVALTLCRLPTGTVR